MNTHTQNDAYVEIRVQLVAVSSLSPMTVPESEFTLSGITHLAASPLTAEPSPKTLLFIFSSGASRSNPESLP